MKKAILRGLKYMAPSYMEGRVLKKRREFYSQFIKEGDLCFDIGANVGNRTDIFVLLGANVVSVEPQATCVEQLRARYKGNPKVVLVDKGVGEKHGKKIMHLSNFSEVSTFSSEFINAYLNQPGIKWDRDVEVSIITMEDLIKEHGVPQFSKIDVEGYELNVLLGLKQPLPALSIEYNARLSQLAFSCVNHIDKMANYEFQFSSFDTMKFYFSEWQSSSKIIELLNKLPKDILTGDIYVRKIKC
jgi:FkbM family methyltransferase|tara:strand:+ start:143 stop:874 length:732 start_codon:yes stop_codon:yes gene_type:complete